MNNFKSLTKDELVLYLVQKCIYKSAYLRNDYPFSTCRWLVNKPEKFSAKGNEFIATSGSIQQLIEYIQKGIAFSPFTFKDNEREKHNCTRCSMVVLDIDDGVTLEDYFKNPIAKKFCASYTTPRHNPEHHKFRAIYFLPCEISPIEYERILLLIDYLTGGFCDKSAKEAGRLFYGCSYAQFYNWDNIYCLPHEIIELAQSVNLPDTKSETKPDTKPEKTKAKSANISDSKSDTKPDGESERTKAKSVNLPDNKSDSKPDSEPERTKAKSANISDNLSDEQISKLIDDILLLIPIKPKGDYGVYREFLCAIKNIKGEDFAIDLAVNNLCKFSDDNWTQIIQSSNGSFSIGTIIDFAKQYEFDYRQWLRENGNQRAKGKGQKVNTREKLDKTYENSSSEGNELDINSLINQLLNKLENDEKCDAERDEEIANFSAQYNVSPAFLRRCLDSRLKAKEKRQDLIELLPNIDNLIKVPKEQLDLKYIFGDFFGIILFDTAKQLPTNPDAIVTCLLPVLASIIGHRKRVAVKGSYKVPFILRTMIVGDSGCLKSPTMRIVSKSLLKREIEAYRQYKEDLAVWEISPSEDKPPKPIRKRYMVSDYTFEGLVKIMQDECNRSLFCGVDELNGYFKRMNKYRDGDDRQNDLQLFDGEPILQDRAGDDYSRCVDGHHAVSVTGTIQPIVLKGILNDEVNDLSGISARWIIWQGDMPLALIDFDRETNYSGFFENLYQNLFNLDIEGDLSLSEECKEIFKEYQNGLMHELKNLGLQQLKARYAKAYTDTVKIAGILHFFHLVSNTGLVDSSVVINAEIMKRAIALGNYYLRHFYYSLTKAKDDLLDSKIIKILELVERKGEINASIIKQYLKTDFGNVSSTEINELLLALIEQGKVEQVDTYKNKGIKIRVKV